MGEDGGDPDHRRPGLRRQVTPVDPGSAMAAPPPRQRPAEDRDEVARLQRPAAFVAGGTAGDDASPLRPAHQDGGEKAAYGRAEDEGERRPCRVRRRRHRNQLPAAAASVRCAWTRCGRSIIRPSSASVPAPGWAAKAATTARAWAISASLGVKAALITGTWSGWMAIIPVKPSRRARAAYPASPS